MPVQPTYPGVYIEEVSSGVRTITGVSTSVAAFIGQCKEGPVDKAVRLLSFADFERNFGQPHPNSELAISVRLFFQNGGSDCYVVRVVKENTGAKAAVVIKNEDATSDVLRFTAKEIGVWGNELALEVDYDTSQPEETFHLRLYRLGEDGTVRATEEFLNCSSDIDSPRFAPNLVTQGSKLADCSHAFLSDGAYRSAATGSGYSESRRPFSGNQAGRDQFADMIKKDGSTSKFRLSVDVGPFYEVNLEDAFGAGSNEATLLAAVKERINQALPPVLVNAVVPSMVAGPGGSKLLRLESATAARKSISVQPASSKDLTGSLLLGSSQGGSERSRYAALRPAATGMFLKLSKLNDLANLPQNSFSKLTIDGQSIDLGINLQTTGPADKWYQGAAGSATTNSDGIREKLSLMAKAINDAGIGWGAKVAGSRLVLQKQKGLRSDLGQIATSPGTDFGSYFAVNTRLYSFGTTRGTYQNQVGTQPGVEGGPPDAASYKGKQSEHTGFYALDLVDLFNLMIIPKDFMLSEADYQGLWAPASVYCAGRRSFLLIDPPDRWSSGFREVLDPSKGIRSLRTGLVKEYSAVFYPRLNLRDNALVRAVGAGGAIAGLMARTDSSRGVWKAPAGTEASIIGISGLDVTLADLENGLLNKEGVNCLRVFPTGIVNWGGRTMAGADDFSSEWKYIPVRRTALFIEESLYRGTQWVVFEPNDEPLWSQIRLNVGAFMHGMFRQGAFQGKTPKEAYLVKCDRETTTQDDINKGIVNILVGFAPLKPAEFVIIKLQQMAGQIQA